MNSAQIYSTIVASILIVGSIFHANAKTTRDIDVVFESVDASGHAYFGRKPCVDAERAKQGMMASVSLLTSDHPVLADGCWEKVDGGIKNCVMDERGRKMTPMCKLFETKTIRRFDQRLKKIQ